MEPGGVSALAEEKAIPGRRVFGHRRRRVGKIIRQIYPEQELHSVVEEDEEGWKINFLDDAGNRYFLHWGLLPCTAPADWGFPEDWDWIPFDLNQRIEIISDFTMIGARMRSLTAKRKVTNRRGKGYIAYGIKKLGRIFQSCPAFSVRPPGDQLPSFMGFESFLQKGGTAIRAAGTCAPDLE